MDKEFLHKINLTILQKEVGLDIQGISSLVDVSPQVVYRWSWDKNKNGTRPTYNASKILLEHGASLETLFGVKEVRKAVTEIGGSISRDEFLAGVREALAALGKA